jgi:hypothetical protein
VHGEGEIVRHLKQERRGGIETALSLAQDQRFSMKQERRGGIETVIPALEPARHPGEAGTPWWH